MGAAHNHSRQAGKQMTARGLLEADVTAQIKDFMEWRNWRAIRMQRTVVPGQFSTGEPGIADFLFVRYLRTEFLGLSVTCWIEMKRAQGGKLADKQIAWRNRELLRGAVVIKASNVSEFHDQYDAAFGWLVSESWVNGQQEIGFTDLVTSSAGVSK